MSNKYLEKIAGLVSGIKSFGKAISGSNVKDLNSRRAALNDVSKGIWKKHDHLEAGVIPHATDFFHRHKGLSYAFDAIEDTDRLYKEQLGSAIKSRNKTRAITGGVIAGAATAGLKKLKDIKNKKNN